MSCLITPLVDMDHCHILTLDNQFYCVRCKKATFAKQGTLERTKGKLWGYLTPHIVYHNDNITQKCQAYLGQLKIILIF